MKKTKNNSQRLVFVIHKHDATRLHYDFRLQIGDVMTSWAIPKGPTLDNTVKRLAMGTTDHSMEYNSFEGVLPEGSYGAGPVIIWDEGNYIPEIETSKGVREHVMDYSEGQRKMKEGYKAGQIKFTLNGKRLKGSFALVKTKMGGMENAWLLIKHLDKFVKKNYEPGKYETSIVSGKTVDELKDN